MPLTKKQRQILDAIVFLLRKGEIPTVREVGALVRLRSPATVLKHLRALESERLITISGKSRGIRIADPELLAKLASSADPAASENSAEEERGRILRTQFRKLVTDRISAGSGPVGIPVAGAIAAGRPIDTRSEAFRTQHLEEQHFEDQNFEEHQTRAQRGEGGPSLALDPGLFAASGELFALCVEGDSMIDAGILDGDYAVIRRQESVEDGEIAAVLINGEATLKHWHCRKSTEESRNIDGEKRPETVRLEAANERFEALEVTALDRKEVLVVGKYVGLVRGARTF